MIRNFATLSLLLGLGAALSGCVSLSANTQDDFFCEAQIGSPCATIASTDGTDAGKTIGITETVEDKFLGGLGSTVWLSEKESLGMPSQSTSSHAYETSRYRVSEQISQLWIAPFLDENQILHQARYVHFVIKDAHWATR